MTAIRKLREKYLSDSTSLKLEMDKLMGTLFHINWYRIILDEGHAIKNYDGASMLNLKKSEVDFY